MTPKSINPYQRHIWQKFVQFISEYIDWSIDWLIFVKHPHGPSWLIRHRSIHFSIIFPQLHPGQPRFLFAKLLAVSLKGYRRLALNDDSPPVRKVLTTTRHQEGRCPTGEEVALQELAEYLGVSLAGTTESDSGCSVQPEANSDQRAEIIIQRSVEELFPKAPADLQKNLQLHMLNIQETVVKELLRVAPLLNGMGLMGHLIGCYHRKTFGHLDTLLQGSRSIQNSFVLLNWVLRTYFR